MWLILFIFTVLMLNAITIPGGDVSGTWTTTDNPYYIDGNIEIPLGQDLTIESGVEIYFNDVYNFMVYGQLIAQGNEDQPIIIAMITGGSGWQGIRFIDTSDNGQEGSLLSYCEITDGTAINIQNQSDDYQNGGAVYCSNSGNIVIDNCYFSTNYAGWDGGAICLYDNSDIVITNSTFENNSCGFYGAALAVYGSAPYVYGCSFSSNDATFFAGAITFWNGSDILVENCEILNNTAGANGGIYGVSSNGVFKNCLFAENETSLGTGGAGGAVSSTTEFINCTFANNVTVSVGGGLWILNESTEITNCIFWGNSPDQINLSGSTAIVQYSDMQGGWEGTGNLDLDPGFVNASNHDYQLDMSSSLLDQGTADTTGLALPEIDLAGNPRVSDGDLDGNFIIDMGCYEYFTGFNLVLEAETQDFNDVYLNWNIEGNTAEIDGFRIYQDYEMLIQIDDDHTANYLVEGLDAGTYQFYITALISGEESDSSNIVSVTTSLPAPVNLTAESGVGSAILNWEAPTRQLLFYNVYREGVLLANNITETTYEDEGLETGNYTYSVSAVYSGDYESAQTDPVSVDVTFSDDMQIPVVTAIEGNYPNPFNPNTAIQFSLAQSTQKTEISIYNAKGQKVITLFNDKLDAGSYNIDWIGVDSDNNPVASGIYFVRMNADGKILTKSVTLLK